MDTIALMRKIEDEYRLLSGLKDYRYYKIYYNRIDPEPMVLLGINPGGSPDQPDEILSASDAYCEHYEHDYVDCNYVLQRVMLPFLRLVLGATVDEVRRVPKTNLAFRRSPNEDSFKKFHHMSLGTAMKEAHPSTIWDTRFRLWR